MEKRYLRQRKLVSQEILKNSKVLIAGVGGLGGFSALYLTLAGIGTIILVDDDYVEESNLNRQVLYRDKDIGSPKVYVAAERLKEFNSEVNIIPIKMRISKDFNIPYDIDVVVDGLDNIESRFLIENFSLKRKIPYVFGAVEGFMGMVTFIDKTTKMLEDFLKILPKESPQVLGATAAFTASLQAMEVLKYLSRKGELLKNRLLVYDGFSTNFMEVKL